MKKVIYLILFMSFSLCLFAQSDVDLSDNIEAAFDTSPLGYYLEYKLATPERKCEIDSIMKDYENFYKSKQVKSICGIEFGLPYEKVLPVLKRKFGEPSEVEDAKTIRYKDVRYAGYTFDNVFFMFQSDGYNTFFNTCIFVKSTKQKEKALDFLRGIKFDLEKKYDLERFDIDAGDDCMNDNPFYRGGVSPIWPGDWRSYVINVYNIGFYSPAVRTDIIEYDENIEKVFDIKFGARLIYGPYEYVKEEF